MRIIGDKDKAKIVLLELGVVKWVGLGGFGWTLNGLGL